MTKIRITKQFDFEMAHALKDYDGACLHIHGHSYKLYVTVIGSPIQDKNDPKSGMVIDFKILKQIVNREIIDKFDHALVFNEDDFRAALEHRLEKVVKFPFQPTCENMIAYFAEKIAYFLPSEVKLHHLKLHETATSFAEWYADDNQ